MLRITLILGLSMGALVHAEVVSYEALTSFPEEQGWQIDDTIFPADRFLENGRLVQVCEFAKNPEGNVAEKDTYVRSIAEFADVENFFVEWRVETDGPNEAILSTAPASLVMGGQSGIGYHFTIADDQARFILDVAIPAVWVDIEPGAAHTYYLKLSGAEEYVWYVDGVVVDSGVPEGAFPSSDSMIGFRGKGSIVPVLTCWWDFVRYGVRPTDGAGDYNGDGAIGLDDLYFFEDCLAGPQGSWPGCAWADMDGDGATTCADWALFQDAWTGSPPPPAVPQCDCPADLNGSGSVDAGDLAVLLGGWGPNPGNAADLNQDGMVNAADLAQLLGNWGSCSP